MVRPTVISDDDILKAARAVFGEKGFRATTAEVAARARVSEGSIFKRFGSKAHLFRAATSTAIEVDQLLETLLGFGPLKTVADFEELTQWMAGVLKQIVPLALIGWSQPRAEGSAPPTLTGERPPPVRAVAAATKFFERQMREGALRKRDPEGVARILIGSLWYFAFMEASLEQRNTGLSSNAFCKELARMLHDDLRPRR